MEGSTLYASCRNSNGQWQSASLPDFQRCSGDIGNNDGTLRCDMRRNEYQPAPQANEYRPAPQNNWQNGVPGGSYAQTCRDIRTNGNTLEATCDTGNGDWTRSALQDINQCKPETIQNIYGRLECTKADYNQGYGQGNGQGYGQGGRRDNGQGYGQGDRRDYGAPEVPDGAYMQSCRNIRISGSTLLATCQLRNGRWRQASLRYFNQCTSEIENSNGRLACSR
jgi:hypothetical protein